MKFTLQTLDEMTAQEFCKIAEERTKVFVVEQNCPYQEIDQEDYHAYHLILWNDDGLFAAYSRIMDEGNHATFGRVLVPMEFRKNHYGRLLVAETIKQTQKLFPNKPIIIEGQAYLTDFYKSFGMKQISEVFLLDNIPHIKFQLDPAKNAQ